MKALAAALAALVLTACATGPVPQGGPTLANIQLLRGELIAPMAVGPFALAPGKPASMDRTIVVRAGAASPPEGKSFARFLASTLETELRGAGKLDPASTVVVTGLLTHSEANANMPEASARLAAVFVVTREGRKVFEKELSAESRWKSQFIGALAIPEAFDAYTALYPKLVGTLLADEDFRRAVKP